MQFSHAVILAFVASVAAQTGSIDGDVAALPACAKTCIDKATLGAGCKTITDYECQCGDKYGEINAAAAPCVATTCEASDLAKTLALTGEICALVKAGGSSSGGDESSSADSSAASSTAAPSSTGESSTAAPTESGESSTGGAAPTTTGGSEAPSSTGETEPTTTGEGGEETPTDGGAAPTSSEGAAATGSWSFAAVAAGAGVVAAGLL